MDRRHRKLMLFASMLEVIVANGKGSLHRWVQYENQTYCLMEGHDYLGIEISKTKLDQHLKGRGVSNNSAETYDIFIRELFLAEFSPFSEPILDQLQEISVFDFGKLIGIPIDQARFIIDYKYAATFPSFSTFSETPKMASKFSRDHGGIYYLYRFDRNQSLRSLGYPLGAVLRSDVVVRYPVPYKGLNLRGKDSYRVRCKMNLPEYERNSDGMHPLLKYDGYVSKKGSGWWQWLFQLRKIDHQNSEDLILMYSERKPSKSLSKKSGFEIRRGVMLHQSQSTEMEPCTNRVILTRLPGHKIEEAEPPSDVITSVLTRQGDKYFQMNRPERESIRAPKIFDLHKKQDLDPVDLASLEALMDEEYNQNVVLK